MWGESLRLFKRTWRPALLLWVVKMLLGLPRAALWPAKPILVRVLIEAIHMCISFGVISVEMSIASSPYYGGDGLAHAFRAVPRRWVGVALTSLLFGLATLPVHLVLTAAAMLGAPRLLLGAYGLLSPLLVGLIWALQTFALLYVIRQGLRVRAGARGALRLMPSRNWAALLGPVVGLQWVLGSMATLLRPIVWRLVGLIIGGPVLSSQETWAFLAMSGTMLDAIKSPFMWYLTLCVVALWHQKRQSTESQPRPLDGLPEGLPSEFGRSS